MCVAVFQLTAGCSIGVAGGVASGVAGGVASGVDGGVAGEAAQKGRPILLSQLKSHTTPSTVNSALRTASRGGTRVM